ncbi:MAG: hypothetical protein K1X28_00450 [Parachlamydiales bacterium]|nr:hypothetical protein [Parachlamydiales bacterium]
MASQALLAPPTTPPRPTAPDRVFFPSPMRDQVARRKSEPTIAGNFMAKYREIQRLQRIVSLHQSMPERRADKQALLAKISTIWDNAQKQLLISEQEAMKAVQEGFKKLGNPEITEIYLPGFDRSDDFVSRLIDCAKDTQAVLIAPLRVSDAGKKGPTLLVTYPSGDDLQSYVIKFTNASEIGASHIYEAFSGCLYDDPRFSAGFFVPEMSRIDLKSGLHETTAGEISELTPDQTQAFLNVLKTIAKPKDPEDTQLMCMDRIRGPNLFDAAYTQYPSFSQEQRKKFFERLGRLAMLDLILGHTDRLVGVLETGDGYALDDALEANLGNVLVVPDAGKPAFSLYAIDNGLDRTLINDETERAKYLEFLKALFAKDDPYTDLAENIITMFNSALSTQIDEFESSDHKSEKDDVVNVGTINAKLKDIRTDLKGLAKESLIKGLKGMAEWLRHVAVPKLWDSSVKAKALQGYLQETNPQMLEAIVERLKGVFA